MRQRRRHVRNSRDELRKKMQIASKKGQSAAATARALGVDRATLAHADRELYKEMVRNAASTRAGQSRAAERAKAVAEVLRRLIAAGLTPSLRNASLQTGRTWLPRTAEADFLILLRRELGDDRVAEPRTTKRHGSVGLAEIASQGVILRREFGQLFRVDK